MTIGAHNSPELMQADLPMAENAEKNHAEKNHAEEGKEKKELGVVN